MKAKLMWIILALGVLLIALFSSGLYSTMLGSSTQNTSPPVTTSTPSDEPSIVKTIPDNLDQSTILPNQTLEITFSHTLVNLPETRWEIQPSVDIRSELSDDRKTLRLIPNTPFNLGQGYTLFIRPDTKIEGKRLLEKEYIYHFKTIEFKGA